MIISERDDFRDPMGQIRIGWNVTRMLRRGPLTDRQIEKYRREGWYSSELKEARREMLARREARRSGGGPVREGNFVRVEGKLVYSPV